MPAYCRDVQHPRAVVIDDLVLRYGSITAVDGVSLTLDFGTVTALLGPNGAGKTSLIEACEGIRRPTSGSILVNGRNPLTERNRIVPPIGVMLQSGGIYPAARVEETIADYCALYGQGKDADELIHMVGLSHRRRASWKTLSGGERQRLALALALSARPTIAFLDEPTSGVDLDGRDAIADIVRRLASDGCAVLISTHDVAEVDAYSDRVVIIKDGRIAADRHLKGQSDDVVEVRFRAGPPLDVTSLSRELAVRVDHFDADYILFGESSLVPRLSHAVTSQGSQLRDLRVTSGIEALYRQIVRGVAQ